MANSFRRTCSERHPECRCSRMCAPSEGSPGGHTGGGNSPWHARGHGSPPLTDGEDEDGRAKGQQPGGGKRDLVGAKPDAEEAAAICREGCAHLMAKED